MPNPKRRHSKTRTAKRRTHDALQPVGLSECPHCHEPKPPHRVMNAHLRQEIQWAADYFTSGVWGTDKTPTALWDDYANSDPVGDVRTGIATVLQKVTLEPVSTAVARTA